MRLTGNYQIYRAQNQVGGRAGEHVVEHHAETAANFLVCNAYGPGLEPVKSAEKSEGKDQCKEVAGKPGGRDQVPNGLVDYDSLVVVPPGIGTEFMSGQRRHYADGYQENRIPGGSGREYWQKGKPNQRAYGTAACATLTPSDVRGEIAEPRAGGDESGYSRRNSLAHLVNFNRISRRRIV